MSPRLTPDLSVGFEQVDGQHRQLFQHLEALVQAVSADDVASARKHLAELGDYLAGHFGEEESMMDAARYPERGRHKSAHDLFTQDIIQLGRDLATSGLSVPVVEWITVRVPEWLKFHIKVNDAPLGRFLASKRPGAEPAAAARVQKPRTA